MGGWAGGSPAIPGIVHPHSSSSSSAAAAAVDDSRWHIIMAMFSRQLETRDAVLQRADRPARRLVGGACIRVRTEAVTLSDRGGRRAAGAHGYLDGYSRRPPPPATHEAAAQTRTCAAASPVGARMPHAAPTRPPCGADVTSFRPPLEREVSSLALGRDHLKSL
eukprot:363634-Chlamydomonas_euryale.AAC.25